MYTERTGKPNLSNDLTCADTMSASINELERAARKGRLLPFVGAGVSAQVKKKDCPEPLFMTWSELVNAIGRALNGESFTTGEALQHKQNFDKFLALNQFPQAAAEARKCLSEDVWYDLLEGAFLRYKEDANEKTLEYARRLWTLNSRLVLTTNYDHVMEWAWPYSAEKVSHLTVADILNLARVEWADPDRPVIFHLHGDIAHLHTIILTLDEYNLLYHPPGQQEHPGLEMLRKLLKDRSVLFAGFSFNDSEVREQLRQVAEVAPGYRRQHYALVRAQDQNRVEEVLKSCPEVKIRLIPLEEFLEPGEIARSANAPDPQSALYQAALAKLSRLVPPWTVRRSMKSLLSWASALFLLLILWWFPLYSLFPLDDFVAALHVMVGSASTAAVPDDSLRIVDIDCMQKDGRPDDSRIEPVLVPLIDAAARGGAKVLAIDEAFRNPSDYPNLFAKIREANNRNLPVILAADSCAGYSAPEFQQNWSGHAGLDQRSLFGIYRWWTYRLFSSDVDGCPSLAVQAVNRMGCPRCIPGFEEGLFAGEARFGNSAIAETSYDSAIYPRRLDSAQLQHMTVPYSALHLERNPGPDELKLLNGKLILFGEQGCPSDTHGGRPGYVHHAAAIVALLSPEGYFRRQGPVAFVLMTFALGFAAATLRRRWGNRHLLFSCMLAGYIGLSTLIGAITMIIVDWPLQCAFAVATYLLARQRRRIPEL